MNDYVLFDITRLVLRSMSETPTGIDRVELAYAKHMLTNYRKRVRFVVSIKARPQIVPTAVAARYIQAIDRGWTDVMDPGRLKDARRLSLTLGVSVASLESNGPKHLTDLVRKARRTTLAALMLLRSAMENARPRNLIAFSRGGRHAVYVNVSHEGIGSKTMRRWLAISRSATAIFFLHDLIPITHPEFVRPGDCDKHVQRIETMMLSATTIIVNSEFTRTTLGAYERQTGKVPVEVVTAKLGVSPLFQDRRLEIPDTTPYFIYVGTIEPRKNHQFLLEIWRQLVHRMGEATPKLVLVGRRGWENENAVDLIERGRDIQSHVIECNGLPDSFMVELVAGARALLFPSHVEGFGLPVVEALSLGTPVICSDIAALREVSRNIPEFISPIDGAAWLDAIENYTEQRSARRVAQLTRGNGFRAPTWKEHFQVFDNVLASHAELSIAA